MQTNFDENNKNFVQRKEIKLEEEQSKAINDYYKKIDMKSAQRRVLERLGLDKQEKRMVQK